MKVRSKKNVNFPFNIILGEIANARANYNGIRKKKLRLDRYNNVIEKQFLLLYLI